MPAISDTTVFVILWPQAGSTSPTPTASMTPIEGARKSDVGVCFSPNTLRRLGLAPNSAGLYGHIYSPIANIFIPLKVNQFCAIPPTRKFLVIPQTYSGVPPAHIMHHIASHARYTWPSTTPAKRPHLQPSNQRQPRKRRRTNTASSSTLSPTSAIHSKLAPTTSSSTPSPTLAPNSSGSSSPSGWLDLGSRYTASPSPSPPRSHIPTILSPTNELHTRYLDLRHTPPRPIPNPPSPVSSPASPATSPVPQPSTSSPTPLSSEIIQIDDDSDNESPTRPTTSSSNIIYIVDSDDEETLTRPTRPMPRRLRSHCPKPSAPVEIIDISDDDEPCMVWKGKARAAGERPSEHAVIVIDID